MLRFTPESPPYLLDMREYARDEVAVENLQTVEAFCSQEDVARQAALAAGIEKLAADVFALCVGTVEEVTEMAAKIHAVTIAAMVPTAFIGWCALGCPIAAVVHMNEYKR